MFWTVFFLMWSWEIIFVYESGGRAPIGSLPAQIWGRKENDRQDKKVWLKFVLTDQSPRIKV